MKHGSVIHRNTCVLCADGTAVGGQYDKAGSMPLRFGIS